jgi:hypothetical protein
VTFTPSLICICRKEKQDALFPFCTLFYRFAGKSLKNKPIRENFGKKKKKFIPRARGSRGNKLEQRMLPNTR